MRKHLLVISFIAVLFFLILSRFILLNKVPATLTHDETVYAVNAYSYVVQGTDLGERHKPWDLVTDNPLYAEWPAAVISIGFKFFKDPLVATHFPPALLGVLFPIFFGWLLYGIWKKKQIFFAGMIVSALNPIIFVFSRLGYDVFFSIFFYIAGIAVLLNAKKWFRLFSIPLLTIGFFQYQGFKLLLFPAVVIFTLLYLFQNNLMARKDGYKNLVKRIDKYILVTIFFSFFLTAFYAFLILPGQDQVSDRLQHTIFTDRSYVQKIVTRDRFLSFSSPALTIFTNKFTVMGEYMAEQLVNTYNPYFLFVADEPGMPLFAWSHGIFYWIEGIFMLCGFFFLFAKKSSRAAGLILLASLVILNIPNLINTVSSWYTFRGMFAYVMLLIVASFGLAEIWKITKLRPIILIIYVLSVVGFGYQYFFRYPLIALDAGNYDERVLSHYLSLHHNAFPQNHIEAIVDQPEYRFYNYLIYAHSLTNKNKNEIAKEAKANRGSFTVDNITFSNECPKTRSGNTVYVQGSPGKCFDAGVNALHIVAIRDSGSRYTISNDQLCGGSAHAIFINIKNVNDLDVENMSTEQFCKNWLVRFLH